MFETMESHAVYIKSTSNTAKRMFKRTRTLGHLGGRRRGK
jgi:hypothetical protein